MYVRTPLALVWIDDQTTGPASPTATDRPRPSPTPAPSAALVRWAKRSWPVARGTCVALREDPQCISVAIRTPEQQLLWLPVDQVLSQTALRRWIEQGF